MLHCQDAKTSSVKRSVLDQQPAATLPVSERQTAGQERKEKMGVPRKVSGVIIPPGGIIPGSVQGS